MNIQLNGANSKNERDRIDYERAMQDFEQDKITIPHMSIDELFEGYEGDFVSEEIDWGEPVGEDTISPYIENWGNNENETMKGYILYALEEIKRNDPEQSLTDKQVEALIQGLNWATYDMTAQEAYDFWVKK